MPRLRAIVLTAMFSAVLCHAANWKDAEVAAWITAQGGYSTKDTSGHITAVNLTSTWVTDADLARLANLSSLRQLDLAHTKITDVGMEHLSALTSVSTLSLYYAEYITDESVAHLKGWTHLERLNLRGTKITSKVFVHLAHLTALKSLDLASTQIDDEGFEELPALTHLEQLAIGGNRLTGSCLPLLKAIPSLRRLDVGGMQRVDAGLWGLALSDNNLQRLGDLTLLESLSLSAANLADRVTDRPGSPQAVRSDLRDLSPLTKLTNLEVLDLTGTPVSADALAALARLPKLRELRLGLARNIDDAAVPRILALPELKVLYLAGSAVSEKGLAQLKDTGRFEPR